MKNKISLVFKPLLLSVMSLLLLQTAGAEPSDETIVHLVPGKKRVHVEACKRMPKEKEELEKTTKMTYEEAKKKGYALCSRCPGSPTPKKEKEEEKE